MSVLLLFYYQKVTSQ